MQEPTLCVTSDAEKIFNAGRAGVGPTPRGSDAAPVYAFFVLALVTATASRHPANVLSTGMIVISIFLPDIPVLHTWAVHLQPPLNPD
ncbi:hypothetical protein [Streptomyces aureus]|uniref:hypothetical protein n=1 Tax=Streptomyces aureus TaxID=193461 RepID=UPI00131E1508|nr:hypothetical protein [Streptomyces aureus]